MPGASQSESANIGAAARGKAPLPRAGQTSSVSTGAAGTGKKPTHGTGQANSVVATEPQRGIFARLRGIDRLFLLTVLVPTTLAVLYFGFIASDIFISESHFVVRNPGSKSSGGLSSLVGGAGGGLAALAGAGSSSSPGDSSSVTDFMNSRDALRQLDKEFDFKRLFGSPQIDRVSRFAGLDFNDSFEALFKYYQNHVTATVDATTSINVLTVRGFKAEDVRRINERLLELGEQLVNALNERGFKDTIRFAEDAVTEAEHRDRQAALAVSGYRHREAVFDPSQQAGLQLQAVATLQGELSAAKTRLAQIRSLAKDNPQIRSLERLVDATQAEIDVQSDKVTGRLSLANKSAEYEGLVLEKGFADKQLETAQASLVQARNDAVSKQLYLVRTVQPNRQDIALEPRRLRSILATLVFGLIAWGVLSLLAAGVKEHQG
ncbi:capsule biosynthesis protein [uncultured Thiodictyon sp.]|uniref:capsule biosynthesis protein n=1 Tax=uncultured Thiodictyon sp. TaxID=1846217 RepID=UPI0025ED60CA|nr:capsule biosynthesis protein [uncultured Thiodictyon sp.]